MESYKTNILAVVQGLKDGGAEMAYNYPGFLSHDIFELLGGRQISINERVAYSEAFGSCLAGRRSVVTFKNVGLNIACDAYFHSIISGVRAGLVMVVTDDVEVWGSQESQDSRSYFDFYGGLWLEPDSSQEAYNSCRKAFDLSEEFDVPVAIRLTNAYLRSSDNFKRCSEKLKKINYRPIRREKFLVHPYFFKQQHKLLKTKNKKIEENFKTLDNRKRSYEYDKGIVIVGAAETPKNLTDFDVIKLTTYPLPTESLKYFIKTHKEIEVYECGIPFVSKKISQLMSSPNITSHVPTSLATKTRFIQWARYARFFRALKSCSPAMVFSDITQFTAEKNGITKASLSLGTSISSSIGYSEASPDNYVFCLTGDSSFLHEGIGIIDEALQRRISLGIIVFDNGGSWCTGGQKPAGDIRAILDKDGLQKVSVDYSSASEIDIKRTLEVMRNFRGVSIMYMKVPMGSFSWEKDDED